MLITTAARLKQSTTQFRGKVRFYIVKGLVCVCDVDDVGRGLCCTNLAEFTICGGRGVSEIRAVVVFQK